MTKQEKKPTPKKRTVKKRTAPKKKVAAKKRAVKKRSIKKRAVKKRTVKKSPPRKSAKKPAQSKQSKSPTVSDEKSLSKDGSEKVSHSSELLTPVVGRPTRYSQAMSERILVLLSMGYSLNKICGYPDMPAISTVLLWLTQDSKKDFLDKYTQARAVQTNIVEDEIFDIADNVASPAIHKGEVLLFKDQPIMVVDQASVQLAKLRVDTRFRHLAAMKKDLYGNKETIQVNVGLLGKMQAAASRKAEHEKTRTFNESGDLIEET